MRSLELLSDLLDFRITSQPIQEQKEESLPSMKPA